MQQTKSYWRFVALAGVVTAFVASACVVTSSTDDQTGGASSSAGANSAGASSAGANSSAGAGGASAGAATGGGAGASAAGAGGAAPVSYQCDPVTAGTQGTPNSCAPSPGYETDVCALCVQSKCCTEFSACYATGPGDQCGWGGPNDMGEITCVQKCIQDGITAGGVYDSTLVGTCANKCTTQKARGSAKECGEVIGTETSELVACLGEKCQTECFGG